MSAQVARMSDYRRAGEADDLRAQLDAIRAERDQLRTLVLQLSDAIEHVRQIEQATARSMADEAYQRGRRDESEAAYARAWVRRP